jgi:hypothetical protein
MGIRTTTRTRVARVSGAVAALLAVASVFAAAPAGASNQGVTFTLTPIAFGSVVLGTSTTGQSIVTNTTAAPLYYLSAHPGTDSTGAEFHASAGTCTGALAPGAQCDVAVVFQPNAKGLRVSTLTVRFGEKNGQGVVTIAASFATSLRGRGAPPTFTLTGGSAGSVPLKSYGSVSATLQNTSNVPLTLHGYHLSNVVDYDFRISGNTCGVTPLLPGGSCSIVARFAPRHLGTASVTLTASMLVAGTRASLVAHQTTLTGVGVTVSGRNPPLEVSPIDFGQVTVGETAMGTAVVTDTSLRAETFQSAAIQSDASGAYAVTGDTCTLTIASGASCDITVTYSPAAAVTHNADLLVKATLVNAHGVLVTVAAQGSLTGRGVNPTFTLTPSAFTKTSVGASSNGTVTVTNTSLVALNYSATAFQGSDLNSWAQTGNACLGPIPAGGACNLQITFSPHNQGTLAITIQVTLDLTVRSHTQFVLRRHGLYGRGVLPTFNVSTPSLPSTPKDVAVTAQAQLLNTSSVSLSYSGFGISGTNAAAFTVTGTTCSGLLAPGASCNLTVQFKPLGSPGTKTASLKVIMQIAGIAPSITTAKNTAISAVET